MLKEYLEKEYDSFVNIRKKLKEQNCNSPSASIELRLKELEDDMKYNRSACNMIVHK